MRSNAKASKLMVSSSMDFRKGGLKGILDTRQVTRMRTLSEGDEFLEENKDEDKNREYLSLPVSGVASKRKLSVNSDSDEDTDGLGE